MALDRAAYNTLADDSSTPPGANGSIWNKAAIKNVLLDPIDAALATNAAVNVKFYGAKGDNATDDTAFVEAALVVAQALQLPLYFPSGHYLLNYSVLAPTTGLVIGDGMELYGDGRQRTFLKNNSATSALLSIPGYCDVHDFTVDNNAGAGQAVRVYGAYSHLHDVEITNQGSGAYALNCTTPSLSTYTNLQLTNCFNGIEIGNPSGISYLTFRGVLVEPAGGIAIHAVGSTNLTFVGLYVENINAIGNHTTLVYLERCVDVTFVGFSCELFGTLTDAAYFRYEDCRNINHYGGKINLATGGTANKILYGVTGTVSYTTRNINWDGQVMFSAKNGTVLFDFDGSNNPTNINIRNVTTELSGTGITGVRFTRNGVLCSVENWTNANQDAAMTFAGTAELFARNLPASSPITVATAVQQLFVNCAGSMSGTGVATATRIESAAAGLVTGGSVVTNSLKATGADPLTVYTNSVLRLTISAAGALTLANHVAGTPTRVAGDKYLLVDSSGNIHVSADGPAT